MPKKSSKKVIVKKTPAVAKKDEPKKEKSKMDLCEEWMSDHPGKTRAEIIEVFVTKLGLTKNGAGTYVQILKKRLNYKVAKRQKKEKPQ